MTPGEQGFLLLTSKLGDPERKPLTVAQFRILASRVRGREPGEKAGELHTKDLTALGYGSEAAAHILQLLEQTDLLRYYLAKGKKQDCCPITRISPGYPAEIRARLGLDSPGCFWAKGDIHLLDEAKLALVGSRDLQPQNREFAWEAGRQAALQGYVLVSGNARGADRTAQQACLEYGGKVICVVADSLEKYPLQKHILYLSEDSFDLPFSTPRAHSRNRIIHSLGCCTLVAQSSLEKGGTWAGTVKNLSCGWTPVFCFRDDSSAARALCQMGAQSIVKDELADFRNLRPDSMNFIGR